MNAEETKLALGVDAVGDLLALWEISEPLFYRYRRFRYLTEYYEQEGQRNNSLGLPDDHGKAHAILTLGVVSIDEYQLLRTYRGVVTARLYKKTADEMGNFNGQLVLPPPSPDQWRMDCWQQIKVYLWQLEELI